MRNGIVLVDIVRCQFLVIKKRCNFLTTCKSLIFNLVFIYFALKVKIKHHLCQDFNLEKGENKKIFFTK